MSSSDAYSESGLSLVEVIVALAITSMLALAMMYFLSTATRLRDVSERTGKIEQALVGLVGLSANLGQSEPLSAVAEGASEIEIVYEQLNAMPYQVTVELAQKSGPFGPFLRATGSTVLDVAVDLSVFDVAVMQIFAQDGVGRKWRDTDPSMFGTSVYGIRLRLSSMSRTWFPMIWSRSLETPEVEQ